MRRILLLFIALLLLAGCTHRRPSGTLSGTVTYKGRPVNGAALMLYTIGGGDEILIPVDQDGTFRSSDLPPGEYKAVVQGTEGSVEASTEGMPPEKLAKVKDKLDAMKTPATIPFPKKYQSRQTSTLVISINEGAQKLDLDLTD